MQRLRRSSQARIPRFFKVILQPSISDGRIEIPVEFVRNLGRELPDVATLKVLDGRQWSVKLENLDGAVWLTNGWREFLKYYNISVGHFVVFKYDGSLNFSVVILNVAGFEVKYPQSVDTAGQSNLSNKGSTLERKKRVRGVQFVLGKKRASTYEVGSTSEPRGFCRLERMKQNYQRKMQGLPYRSNLSQVKKDRSKEGEDIFYVKHKEHIPTPLAEKTRRPLTTLEKEQEKFLAQMLKTEKPSFMVVMKPSYLVKGLNLPLAFAREHFKEGAHNIILQLPNGRKWYVRFCFQDRDIKALLSGGWNTFVQDNMLQCGDFCVFELLKVGKIEFKVSIFRVVEEVVLLCSFVTGEARCFKSEKPFFEVYLHPSYANGNYVILKTMFVERNSTNNFQRVRLQDTERRKWYIRCSKEHGHYKLGAGRTDFANKNDIKEGDICVLEPLKNKSSVLKFSIFKSH